jgi:hypothetical protein
VCALVSLFLCALLPVINLRLTLYETLGERFLYLPTVFSCLLMAYLAVILLRRQTLLISLLIGALVFYSVALFRTNRTWREAANLSQSITNELVDSAAGDHLIILNAPDSLRGVPVFHNGLPEALEYFQNRKHFRQIEIIAFQELQSAAQEVSLASRNETLTLVAHDNAGFDRVESSACVGVAAHSRTMLELNLQPCSANADLFFFDQGRMVRLPGK